MDILECQALVLQPCMSHCGDHALFDLGSGPSCSDFLETMELKLLRIDSTFFQMNFEDLQPLISRRQIDKKYFVKPPFTDHFRREQIDSVGGGGDKQAAVFSLHPRQKESEDAPKNAFTIAGLSPQSAL